MAGVAGQRAYHYTTASLYYILQIPSGQIVIGLLMALSCISLIVQREASGEPARLVLCDDVLLYR